MNCLWLTMVKVQTIRHFDFEGPSNTYLDYSGRAKGLLSSKIVQIRNALSVQRMLSSTSNSPALFNVFAWKYVFCTIWKAVWLDFFTLSCGSWLGYDKSSGSYLFKNKQLIIFQFQSPSNIKMISLVHFLLLPWILCNYLQIIYCVWNELWLSEQIINFKLIRYSIKNGHLRGLIDFLNDMTILKMMGGVQQIKTIA